MHFHLPLAVLLFMKRSSASPLCCNLPPLSLLCCHGTQVPPWREGAGQPTIIVPVRVEWQTFPDRDNGTGLRFVRQHSIGSGRRITTTPMCRVESSEFHVLIDFGRPLGPTITPALIAQRKEEKKK
uniref:Putative secreted protein n=1 Tax=Anopheles marajoara TaxID=58244 RepID=A0A2M4C717_9DIPT